MIPFLKRLGFLDQGNVPTKVYIDFRDESKSHAVMAEQIKKSYQILFSANEYAYKLDKEQVKSKLISTLGVSKDDITIPKVAATFMELKQYADFENKEVQEPISEENETPKGAALHPSNQTKLGITYTINLNLPNTTDPKVFDAIFKSLKEYLLK
jgi:hypothetical protein